MPELSPLTEIERAKAGDTAAAEMLVRRVGRIALPLAVAVLHDRDAAGEVSQDVAVEVLRGLRKLRDPGRFDAWVRRIAVRQTLRAARARRLRRSSEVSLENRGSDREPRVGSEPDEAADALALRAALRVALADVPPRQRVALALRYVHDLSEVEVAHALGCQPGTAASLLSRGRRLLRQHEALAELSADPLQGGC